jgi:outer membrane protein assembly factor BamA
MRSPVYSVILLLLASEVKSQRLEEILVYGHRTTNPEVILRELEIDPDSQLNEKLLRRERDWLLRLDFLKRIDFLTKSGALPDREILMIVVRERSAFSFTPCFDMDDLYGISLGGYVTTYNLRGNRERVRISGMAGGFRYIGFSWQNPWIAGPLRLFMEFNAGYKEFDYLYPDWNDPFGETDLNLQGLIGRHWGRTFRAAISLGFERVEVSDPGVSLSHTGRDDIPKLQIFTEYDSRDWPFYPGNGVYWKTGLERCRMPSDPKLNCYFTDFRAYLPFGRQQTFAFQIAGHLSDGVTPVYKRTHIGGSGTVRGYATGKYAGENIVYSSLEYRFPWLYERNPSAVLHFGINGVVFVDAGSVWWNSETFSLKSVHGSIGLGVHLIWDQWVFRAEYGAHGRGWGFISTGTDVKF